MVTKQNNVPFEPFELVVCVKKNEVCDGAKHGIQKSYFKEEVRRTGSWEWFS
jgi:hypothetical protein